MSTTYPEQLMLPGQAAAPGGPVDMTVMYVMHHGFRRDLTRFASAVPSTPVDDHATWVALEKRWGRFSQILHNHHGGEDAGIWPFLLDRADDQERETLLAMEAEHEKIDPLLESCEQLFAELAGDDGGSGRDREELRAGLTVRLAETRELLGGHLRHEESEAMVILQRHMTQEDWEAIEKEHFQERSDLGFLLYAVSWVAEDLTREQLSQAFATAGQGFRLFLWAGRRKFRKLEESAFRYAEKARYA